VNALIVSKMTILFDNYIRVRFRLLQYQFIAIYEFDNTFDNSIRDKIA
jgi:hypothetical protein